MLEAPDTATHLSALQLRVARLCIGEEELRKLVRDELFNSEQKELLRLVREEYAKQIESFQATVPVERTRALPSLKLPPLISLKLPPLLSKSETETSRVCSTSKKSEALPSIVSSSPLPHSPKVASTESGLGTDSLKGSSPRGNLKDWSKASRRSVASALPLQMSRVSSRPESARRHDTPESCDEKNEDSTHETNGSQMISPKVKNEDRVWTKVSSNAFGAFIHVGLQSGLRTAFAKCSLMVLTAVVIQLTFSEELISNHMPSVSRDSRTRNSICWIPWKFQLCAVVIFITLVTHNLPSMTMAAWLVFTASSHKFGDGENVGALEDTTDTEEAIELNVPFWRRLVICIVGVLTEMTTFVCVLYAGCLFALTADSVDNVIRSTVSVMFVLNVDEIVFDSCCPAKIKADVHETEYLIQKLSISDSTWKSFVYYYVLYGHLPCIMAISIYLVFGLRFLLFVAISQVGILECEVTPFMQDFEAAKLLDSY